MNAENQEGRSMPSDQDAAPEDVASGEGRAPQEGQRPGTTDVQAYIGRQLRAVYDDVVQQPIPDRFLALMKQLEEQMPES